MSLIAACRWDLSIGLVLAVTGLAAAAWLMSQRDRTLVDLAHPVVIMDKTVPYLSLGWLSSHQLLLIDFDRGQKPRNGASSTWHGHAEVFDTATHRRDRVAALTDLFNKAGGPQCLSPYNFELSPDGKSMHWLTIKPVYERRYVHHIALLNGKHYRQWDSDNVTRHFWSESVSHYDRSPVDPHTCTDKMPGRPELLESAVSPQQTTIAYHVHGYMVQPLPAWLHRRFPSIPDGRTIREAIWVSRIDGTGLRELGHVPGGAGGGDASQRSLAAGWTAPQLHPSTDVVHGSG